jgi:hypothetical protein
MSEDPIVPVDEHQIVEVPEPAQPDVDPYHGVSVDPVTQEAQSALDKPLDPEEVDIKEDGVVYLGAHVYRARLNQAFGAMGWGLVPLGDPLKEGNKVYYRARLYANGRFVSESMGESTYYANNAQASWADAVDSAATECLKKCCKNLISGFLPMWDKGWTEKWRRQYAVKVKLKPRQGQRRTVGWRRRDREPLWNEAGVITPRAPKERGDGQTMREQFGLERKEVDPAALEARRQQFTEILMGSPLDVNALETAIGLADTVEQLKNQDLIEQCDNQPVEAKEHLQAVWVQRKAELDEAQA